jgi:alpha,alpha-trehalase
MKKLIAGIFLLMGGIAGAQQLSPRQLYPGLFETVQSSTIFADNKAFVDAIPKRAPALIVKDYNLLKDKSEFDLKQFVLANFVMPDANNKGFQSNIEEGVRKHIDTLWQVLQRKPDTLTTSSLVPLPHPYIVPGGRFREVYYWDSYFTMLGLQQSRKIKVIKNMISNFAYLIDNYGFIPNGNRNYYLTRSQPPFFCMMINLLASEEGNKVFKQYQPQLVKEYNYWMQGAENLAAGQAKLTSVAMPSGQILNRYWDASDKPREESYIKDVSAAKTSAQDSSAFYRNVRAAAASGWDFSSRWFDDSKQLSSIQTTNIVPVDLNCLLYKLELTIARSYKITGDIERYQLFMNKAANRKAAIQKYCWDAKTGWFYDYNWQLNTRSKVKTLAAAFPLEFGISTQQQAQKLAKGLKANFLKPGGLVTTGNHTGQQWDAPNGWAPLEYITIDGLSKCGQPKLAIIIAERWITLNVNVFNKTGKLLEKYNVEDINVKAGGGEYPLQDGFGWTNGVLLTLMNRYHFNDSQLQHSFDRAPIALPGK